MIYIFFVNQTSQLEALDTDKELIVCVCVLICKFVIMFVDIIARQLVPEKPGNGEELELYSVVVNVM